MKVVFVKKLFKMDSSPGGLRKGKYVLPTQYFPADYRPGQELRPSQYRLPGRTLQSNQDFYTLKPGVREFFSQVSLGGIKDKLDPFLNNNIPVSKYFLLVLLSHYVHINNMQIQGTNMLKSTDDFATAFGKIIRSDNRDPYNFNRTYLTELTDKLVEENIADINENMEQILS